MRFKKRHSCLADYYKFTDLNDKCGYTINYYWPWYLKFLSITYTTVDVYTGKICYLICG